MINDELDHYMSHYLTYKNGHLYKLGGSIDQPAAYIEIMNLIDSVMNEK